SDRILFEYYRCCDYHAYAIRASSLLPTKPAYNTRANTRAVYAYSVLSTDSLDLPGTASGKHGRSIQILSGYRVSNRCYFCAGLQGLLTMKLCNPDFWRWLKNVIFGGVNYQSRLLQLRRSYYSFP
ncbi:hypothetical protein J6590_011994, partial [Homalodisca vitripennis]